MENLSSSERLESLAHRFHMDIFQNGKLDVADEILSPNFVIHNPGFPNGMFNGQEGVKKFASAARNAISNLNITHDDAISKGDKVMIRWTVIGKLTGQLFDKPPTNEQIVITGFDLFRISNGKIEELWQQFTFGNWN